MFSLKKAFLFLFLVSPIFMLAQDQIWYKTQKEVTELIQGNWVLIPHTFEGKEKIKNNEKSYGITAYKKNDSLKVDELYYINNKKQSIQLDINAEVEKSGSEYIFCEDYKYKVFCYKIKFINSTKLILEEGSNISTFKKMDQ